MEEYSVSQWFERRGRQARRNRVFANCLVPAVGLMLLLGYLASPLEKRSHIVNILITPMGVPLGILIAVSIFANASLIAGPYFPTSETVSQTCIAKVVLGVKPAAYIAENAAVSRVPTLGRLLGATEAVAGVLGQAAERLFGWEASIVVSPLIYDELISTCRCPNGG
jgi:hypothetical protein